MDLNGVLEGCFRVVFDKALDVSHAGIAAYYLLTRYKFELLP